LHFSFTARHGARYWLRIAISTYPTCNRRPVRRGVPVGILPWHLVRKNWCGYPTVKKFWRYLYSFWQNIRTWQMDGRTERQMDRHHMTAKVLLDASIMQQKQLIGYKKTYSKYQPIVLTISCRLPVHRCFDFTEGTWRQEELNSDMTSVITSFDHIQSSYSKHLTCQSAAGLRTCKFFSQTTSIRLRT